MGNHPRQLLQRAVPAATRSGGASPNTEQTASSRPSCSQGSVAERELDHRGLLTVDSDDGTRLDLVTNQRKCNGPEAW